MGELRDAGSSLYAWKRLSVNIRSLTLPHSIESLKRSLLNAIRQHLLYEKQRLCPQRVSKDGQRSRTVSQLPPPPVTEAPSRVPTRPLPVAAYIKLRDGGRACPAATNGVKPRIRAMVFAQFAVSQVGNRIVMGETYPLPNLYPSQ